MFERMTERARLVIVLAQAAARELRHNYIGTEHILLGLIREKEGLAARVLDDLDITATYVESRVCAIVGRGDDEVTTGQVPFTPRGKNILELAFREALSLGHNYIGTEHLLLALGRESEGIAARILDEAAADAETIRNRVIAALSGPGRSRPVAAAEPTVDDGLASAAWHLAVGLEKRISAIEEREREHRARDEAFNAEVDDWNEAQEKREAERDSAVADLSAEVAELKARPTQVTIIQVVSIVQINNWSPPYYVPPPLQGNWWPPYYVGDATGLPISIC